MTIKANNEIATLNESEDSDEVPDHIASRLSPEDLKKVKEIAKICRLFRERDPEGAAMLDEAVERACEEGYI